MEAAYSWPWKISGVAGPRSWSAVSARYRPGLVSRWNRSPRAELATWSWFWMIDDEGGRRDIERRAASPLALAEVPLALVEPAALEHRDELLRGAEVVAVVRLAAPRGGDHHGVVEVVAPEHVEPEPAPLGRPEQPCALGLVLADDQHTTAPGRRADRPHDRPEDVVGTVVEDALRRVDTQAVDVELVDPVGGVGEDELAHRPGVLAVEVQRLAPLGLVPLREIVVGERLEVVAVGAEVVVHHVEEHGQAEAVGAVDEPAEVVGRAVAVERGEQIDAVVAPAEGAGELGHRHQLERRDPEVGEVRELLRGGGPGPLGA